MIPELNDEGLLPPGIHWATWEEIEAAFGSNEHRARLLHGLRLALTSLATAGCQAVYLDGSFVTAKEMPNDYDGCWDPANVNPDLLDPILLNFSAGRQAQKIKFGGEFFVASWVETGSGMTFLEFFQIDRHTGNCKGIVALDPRPLLSARRSAP